MTYANVNCINDALKYLILGLKNRVTGPTLGNTKSSRSHSIFQITLVQQIKGSKMKPKISRLRIVDLAGSEKFKIPNNISQQEKLIRIQELTSINTSLSTLGYCISSLQDRRRTHIPFRNSKLTRILSDSLSGNSKITFIVCISPSISSSSETFSTLQFANRAKKAFLDGRFLLKNQRSKSRRLKRSASIDFIALSKAYKKEKNLRERLEVELASKSNQKIQQQLSCLKIQNENLKKEIIFLKRSQTFDRSPDQAFYTTRQPQTSVLKSKRIDTSNTNTSNQSKLLQLYRKQQVFLSEEKQNRDYPESNDSSFNNNSFFENKKISEVMQSFKKSQQSISQTDLKKWQNIDISGSCTKKEQIMNYVVYLESLEQFWDLKEKKQKTKFRKKLNEKLNSEKKNQIAMEIEQKLQTFFEESGRKVQNGFQRKKRRVKKLQKTGGFNRKDLYVKAHSFKGEDEESDQNEVDYSLIKNQQSSKSQKVKKALFSNIDDDLSEIHKQHQNKSELSIGSFQDEINTIIRYKEPTQRNFARKRQIQELSPNCFTARPKSPLPMEQSIIPKIFEQLRDTSSFENSQRNIANIVTGLQKELTSVYNYLQKFNKNSKLSNNSCQLHIEDTSCGKNVTNNTFLLSNTNSQLDQNTADCGVIKGILETTPKKLKSGKNNYSAQQTGKFSTGKFQEEKSVGNEQSSLDILTKHMKAFKLLKKR